MQHSIKRTKHAFKICLGSCFSLMSVHSFAFPEQCLTLPTRTTPCEHLIYKRLLSAPSNDVVCVCLQDFQDLIYPASTAEEVKKQTEKFKLLSQQFDMSEKDLKQLIQY